MAKKRINPELFRVGWTKNWPAVIKLQNYSHNVRYLNNLDQKFTNYWLNKKFCKLVVRRMRWRNKKNLNKIKRRQFRFFLFKKLYFKKFRYRRVLFRFFKRYKKRQRRSRQAFNIIQKHTQLRRRIYKFHLYFGRTSFLAKFSRKFRRKYLQRPAYWYKKKHGELRGVEFDKFKKKKQKKNFSEVHAEKRQKKFFLVNRAERRRMWYRNFYNLHLLNIQQIFPYFLQFFVFDTRLSTGGSTALRRYQFNVFAVQPPRWTSYIHLRQFSFRKLVGYILTSSKIQRMTRYHIIMVSQLNLALHWHSSYLFSKIFCQLLHRQYRVQGSLRLMHDLVGRLHFMRYNIVCVKLVVTGSFGKLTRSKILRLGRIKREVSHSVTKITQHVSYYATQIWTIRGVLGLRTWIFW